jgi:hypothetical protein
MSSRWSQEQNVTVRIYTVQLQPCSSMDEMMERECYFGSYDYHKLCLQFHSIGLHLAAGHNVTLYDLTLIDSYLPTQLWIWFLRAIVYSPLAIVSQYWWP